MGTITPCHSAAIHINTTGSNVINLCCLETERQALLAFKKSLLDPSGKLVSWVGQDCCRWTGISCSSMSRHVIKLDVGNRYDTLCYKGSLELWETSKSISPSLLGLRQLEYLDLSCNVNLQSSIPSFFGMFKNLRYLNLSYANFTGEIPPSIGNLSKLAYLDVGEDFSLHVKSLDWLSNLSSLKYLNL